MKKCTKCEVIKDESEFAIIKARGKLKAQCKTCISQENAKWLRNKNEEARKILRREQHIKELYFQC